MSPPPVLLKCIFPLKLIMTKNTKTPDEVLRSPTCLAHVHSPAAQNPSRLQRLDLRMRLKAAAHVQKKKQREKMGKRVVKSHSKCGVTRVSLFAGNGKEMHEIRRCIKIPCKNGKPLAVGETHMAWMRGLGALRLSAHAPQHLVSWHKTNGAMCRGRAFFFK